MILQEINYAQFYTTSQTEMASIKQVSWSYGDVWWHVISAFKNTWFIKS